VLEIEFVLVVNQCSSLQELCEQKKSSAEQTRLYLAIGINAKFCLSQVTSLQH